MMTMADNFERATRQKALANDMKIFAKAFMQKFQDIQTKNAENPQP
jgi:hypothetical protein